MMVGLGRFELPTSPLSGVRSNQLSYRPVSVCRMAIRRKKHKVRLGVVFFSSNDFEDQVEHAEQLRRS